MKRRMIKFYILILTLIASIGIAQIDVDNPESTRVGIDGQSLTKDSIALTTVVDCVRLIDAYIASGGTTTFTLEPKPPQNAGGELRSKDGAITFTIDYTTNCLDDGSAAPAGSYQNITAGLSTAASSANDLNGLTFQLSSILAIANHNGPTNRDNGVGQNNSIAINGTAKQAIKDIRNVTSTGALVALSLDDNEFNFAQATSGTTVTIAFTLSDQQ